MLVETILFITIVLAIVYIVLYAIPKTIPGTTSAVSLKAPTPLLTPSGWSAAPCAVRFLLRITQAPRTVQKVDCVPPPTGGSTTFDPSCPSYEFATCKCDGANCSRCTTTTSGNSYLSRLVWVNNLELWSAGYTSSNDKPFVPAILKVKTASDSSQSYIESVSLPAIPLQRWTVITIVKEGRRFDVYYGSKLVASKLLDHYPIPPGPNDPWMGGAEGWKGSVGFFSVKTKAVNTADVAADVASVVDTQGVPFDQTPFFTELPSFSCPGGNCLKMPKVVPPNPFVTYQTTVS